MSLFTKIVIFIATMLLLCACFSSRYQQKANNMTINNRILTRKSFRLIMKDGTEYDISESALRTLQMDSRKIEVECRIKKAHLSEWNEFKGAIPLDNIDLVQYSNVDYGKSMVFQAGVITLAIMGSTAQEGRDEPEIYIPGGGSCPFIYSWTGDSFVLEAEAISVGLGKELEIQTSNMLPELKEYNSQLKLRIANERPETHYINSAQLVAIESDCTALPYYDSFNTVWPVYTHIAPVVATDHSGNDILAQIHSVDGEYWESDLCQTQLALDFEDKIDLKFIKAKSSQHATIIVHAINTRIANFVFDNIFQFLGDRSLAFIQASEKDTQLINILKDWRRESSLKASIWNGEQWQHIGLVYPEANEVPFAKVIHFTTKKMHSDTLHVRLTSLADVWKIDAVFIDTTQVQPLNEYSCELCSAIKSDNQNVSNELSDFNNEYVTLLPPQYIELIYQAYPHQVGKKTSYGIKVQGYLHEWISSDCEKFIFSKMDFVPSALKIAYIKNLLNLENKSIFLPLIYNDWNQYKLQL